MEIPTPISHVAPNGFLIPSGWNLGLAADSLGLYDSNPASLPESNGDAGQRYSGNLSLSYLSRHTVYQTNYAPSFTYYHQFNSLNSTKQSLSQSFWHHATSKTGVGWTLNLKRFPSWGKSAFADSSFGSLLMELSGLTGLNLKSKVSSADTSFTIEHRPSRRSIFHVDMEGRVDKYTHSNSSQFLSLLTVADSSTWSGGTGLYYDYQLSAHRSLGAVISNSYFLFTAQNQHSTTQSAMLRYSETFRNDWTFLVSAGPELQERQHLSHGIQPGVSFNFDLRHKSRKSALRTSVVRHLQIGQAPGNLTDWTASLSAERAIGRRYFAGVFGDYQRSQSQVNVGQIGIGSTQTFASGLDGGIRIGHHTVWFANYGFSAMSGVLTQHTGIYRQQVLSGLSFNVDSLFAR